MALWLGWAPSQMSGGAKATSGPTGLAVNRVPSWACVPGACLDSGQSSDKAPCRAQRLGSDSATPRVKLPEAPCLPVVHSLNHVQLLATWWPTSCQASLSFTVSWSSLKLLCTESVMPSNQLILCHPLPLLPSIFPSIRVFSNESVLRIRWPKDWNFRSFSISPSSEYSGLISFRMDWFVLLAVQATLKSLLQHHSLKAAVLQRSAFFMVQLSDPYMITEENHSFDYTDFCRQSDVSAL